MPGVPSPENPLLPQTAGWDYSNVLPFARRQQPAAPVQGTDESGKSQSFVAPSVALALPDVIRSSVNELTSALTLPGRVVQGQVPDAALPKEAIGASLALMGQGVGLPKPSLSMGIFGGAKAKTADFVKLSQAMLFEDTGRSPTEIFDKTGWFRGEDSKWRFEIPDEEAKWKEGVMPSPLDKEKNEIGFSYGMEPHKLEDILHHPALFAAYPELGKIKVGPTGLFASLEGVMGGMNDKYDYMRLTRGKPQDVLSTALHETQHAVQNKEGFAVGGNVQEFLPEGHQEAYDRARLEVEDARSQIRKLGANSLTIEGIISEPPTEKRPLSAWRQQELEKVKAVPGLLDRFGKALDIMDSLRAQRLQAFTKYQSLAGEVEARSVQERFANPASGHPFAQPGYPTGPQIVRFKDPVTTTPVEHDPFGFSYHQVEHDPFAVAPAGHNLEPVEHDPFRTSPGKILSEHQDELSSLYSQALAGLKKKVSKK